MLLAPCTRLSKPAACGTPQQRQRRRVRQGAARAQADGGGRSTGARPRPAAGDKFELLSVQMAIAARQQRLQDCVEGEDFACAAFERDALLPLEAKLRHLALGAAADARADVLHGLGQVVQHRRYSYHGVIFGYDPVCMADEEWCQVRGGGAVERYAWRLRSTAVPQHRAAAAAARRNPPLLRTLTLHSPAHHSPPFPCHPSPSHQAMRVDMLPFGRSQPFYHVLVDARDRPGGQTTYVAQVGGLGGVPATAAEAAPNTQQPFVAIPEIQRPRPRPRPPCLLTLCRKTSCGCAARAWCSTRSSTASSCTSPPTRATCPAPSCERPTQPTFDGPAAAA